MKSSFIGVIAIVAVLEAGCGGGDGGTVVPGSGTAGSTARFAIANDTLYTLSDQNLRVFDITVPAEPVSMTTLPMGFGVETLFPHGNYLFVGSTTGMHIYDNTNPQAPQYVVTTVHINGFDPVVVQGNYAYVTVRDGISVSGGAADKLDIVDITDIANPALVQTYAMQEPRGLGIDGNTLFVCDGPAGLKVFDVSNPLTLVELERHTSVDCNDVIPNAGQLVVTENSRLSQYDYRTLPMTMLSEIVPMVSLGKPQGASVR